MSAADLTIAEQIACSICWLARRGVGPNVETVDSITRQRHGLVCDWCEYPPDKLLKLAHIDEKDPRIAIFERQTKREQRAAVDRALHGETEALVPA